MEENSHGYLLNSKQAADSEECCSLIINEYVVPGLFTVFLQEALSLGVAHSGSNPPVGAHQAIT